MKLSPAARRLQQSQQQGQDAKVQQPQSPLMAAGCSSYSALDNVPQKIHPGAQMKRRSGFTAS
jgi:hypothetical protein